MKEKVNTEGSIDFVYSKEDQKRIESEDTESTRNFKSALKNWRFEKKEQKFHFVNKPKNYVPTYPVFVKGKESFWDKFKRWLRIN